MNFGLTSIGTWLGGKLARNPDTLSKDELDLMPRTELIHTIQQLQAKLSDARKAREELGRELLGILERS